jgi:lipopolysaccharide export system permease protein
MRLLDRYLLRELLSPLGYCLGGFLIFWISFDLFNELSDLQENKLRAGDIVEYYVVKSPEFLVEVLPIALLLALLYTLTSLSRHHEITAIRSAGVSLWRLSVPYFVVGVIASAALFVMNEFWVPDSAERAEQVMTRRLTTQQTSTDQNLVRDLGFSNARDGRTWYVGIYNLQTAEMLASSNNPLQINWTFNDGSRRRLYADRAVRTNGVWTLFNVREFRESPGANAQPVPGLRAAVLALPELTETPEEIESDIKISRRLARSIRKARNADLPISEILDYLRFHPNPLEADRSWLYTKLHGRLAAPWTCVVVVLIAVPFGAASGRRNVFVGVASSIFICFGFFVLLQLGLALGAGGKLPPWLGAWLPNLVFGTVGLWMTSRAR